MRRLAILWPLPWLIGALALVLLMLASEIKQMLGWVACGEPLMAIEVMACPGRPAGIFAVLIMVIVVAALGYAIASVLHKARVGDRN